jgi:hypothetical protein
MNTKQKRLKIPYYIAILSHFVISHRRKEYLEYLEDEYNIIHNDKGKTFAILFVLKDYSKSLSHKVIEHAFISALLDLIMRIF